MTRLFAIYGFPVSSDYEFRLDGKDYQLGAQGVYALQILAAIYEQSHQDDDIGWLLPLRGLIREIKRIRPVAALTLVVDRAGNDRLRRLAIWLRGRCGGRLGTSTVSRFSTSTNRGLRKEVVRCLHRLSAWAELRHIACADLDPQIREYARPTPPKPFEMRLSRFSKNVRRTKASGCESMLTISPELDLTQGRPPKPGWLIRIVLERIRRLVAGSTKKG